MSVFVFCKLSKIREKAKKRKSKKIERLWEMRRNFVKIPKHLYLS